MENQHEVQSRIGIDVSESNTAPLTGFWAEIDSMTDLVAQRVCVACGCNSPKPWARGLVSCTICGLVYYPRRIRTEELQELYDETYFVGKEYCNYLASRRAHEANFRQRIGQLSRWLEPGCRVFEIGSSYGLFLNLAQASWKVRGCDISPEPCRYAAKHLGLDVQCTDFRTMEFAPGSVDAFCMWDTIEHLDALDSYLERIASVLHPGGVLTLTTGDIGSLLARVQGPKWRQIHPPTHLWYFSLATLRRTLTRFGFDIVWSRHVAMNRSLGDILFGLTSLGKPKLSWTYRLCKALGISNWVVPLNTYDLLMVVARRNSDPAISKLREAA